MIKQLKISYENLENNSYLTVVFTQESGLINYQLEMITSNEISHLLRSSKRMVNGDPMAYYNISSRIPLSKVLERRKLKRAELLRIIEGAVLAIKDAGEYQLGPDGLVMDPDYIYVDPSDCNPFFVYLPVSAPGDKGIQGLLLDLIVQGKVELSSDNFIQVLLEAVNSRPFSADSLEACIQKFKAGNGTSAAGDRSRLQPGPERMAAGQDRRMQPGINRVGEGPEDMGREPVRGEYAGEGEFSQGGEYAGGGEVPGGGGPAVGGESVGGERTGTGSNGGKPDRNRQKNTAAGSSKQPLPPAGRKNEKKQAGRGGRKEKQAAQRQAANGPVEDEEFDAEKAKKKFVLPQAVIMVAVAALISFGGFTDSTGAIAINNILAVVIIIGVTEIILYREAYVNSRKKPGSKAKKEVTKPDKNDKGRNGKGRTGRPAPPAAGRPAPPAAGRPAPPAAGRPAPPASARPAQEAVRSGRQAGQPEMSGQTDTGGYRKPEVSAPYAQPSVRPSSYYGGIDETEISDETEIWDDSQTGMSAYLEYYENGILTRVPLDKSSVLVGRLRGQVDFAVTNPKVGKVHAEFLNQDGMFYVKDLNSRNGTYINGGGQRISSNVPYPLNDNDRITLADSEFTLRCTVR